MEKKEKSHKIKQETVCFEWLYVAKRSITAQSAAAGD